MIEADRENKYNMKRNKITHIKIHPRVELNKVKLDTIMGANRLKQTVKNTHEKAA
jgi:hypothetical protein